MDVAGWLRGLSLGQYEANFRDNKIDAGMLPRATGDDLKDIGVSALGDRLRLLGAIAVLVGAAPSSIPPRPPKPAPPTSPELTAERRPITVMFCDLVGRLLAYARPLRNGIGTMIIQWLLQRGSCFGLGPSFPRRTRPACTRP
jgi:hypothetical protein